MLRSSGRRAIPAIVAMACALTPYVDGLSAPEAAQERPVGRPPLALAPLVDQTLQLAASDGAAGDFFGVSVAVSGSTAVVGASLADVGANGDQGAAYVFVRTGTVWSQQAKLTASDGAAGDRFGTSVAISGETVVVGAPNDTVGANAGQGSAYVFVRSGTTWTQQQMLTASDGSAGDDFGISVGLDGDTAIVGADLDDFMGQVDQGSAYVFVRSGTTWSEDAHLDSWNGGSSSGGAAGDRFGYSVAVNGDRAIVGAPEADAGGPGVNRGSASLFTRFFGQWSRGGSFVGTVANDAFGTSVSIGPDLIVVGATGVDVGSNADQGTADVFCHCGGSILGILAHLTASDGAANDRFGTSVALRDYTVVVGASGSNSLQGAAYVFAQTSLARTDPPGPPRTGWSAGTRMTANNGAANDFFGASVAVSGDVVLVGAYQGDVGATADLGAAYLFVNSLPTITPIANQTVPEDTSTGALPFTVDDAETAAGSLIVYAGYTSCCSPGPTVVLGGSGASRTIAVTPNLNLAGTTPFTVYVSDGEATAVRTFTVTSMPVNDAPTITSVADQTISEDTATNAVAFTIFDVDNSVSSLTLSGSSSNTTLVPNANITFGGSGESRTVTVTPAANQNGSATITLSVGDGTATTTTTFTVRVVTYAPFSDDVLTSRSSIIRAVHVTELRTRIDALRQAAGLAAYAYADSSLTAGAMTVRAQHILDLRAALAEAYVALSVSQPAYTDPALGPGFGMKAVHIEELRADVIALEAR